MQTHIFLHPKYQHETDIIRVLSRCYAQIAEETDTRHLVIAVYLMPGSGQTRGAYYRRWFGPNHLIATHGKWAISQSFNPPDQLPDRFRLIRMRMDPKSKYPRTEYDAYGWEFRYESFEDHAATLFAHELHHFRRYHLDLHPREGEQGANRWALEHACSLGFRIEGKRMPAKRCRSGKIVKFLQTLPLIDPYHPFRNLKPGDSVRITKDSRRRYNGLYARVVRPLRANAKRLVIETPDGRQWRWPVEWLETISPKL